MCGIQFRLHPGIRFPKPSRGRQEGFGNIRKFPGFARKVSGPSDRSPTFSGRFRDYPKVPRRCQEDFGNIRRQDYTEFILT